jgi:hypothetical protein
MTLAMFLGCLDIGCFFSVCGMLTQGRRNRMTQSLEMRAALKLSRSCPANFGERMTFV